MKILLKLVYLSSLIGLFAAKPDDNLRTSAIAMATSVKCGNITWNNGDFLGNYNGQAVYTIIFENRIYIRWDGRSDQSKKNEAFDNIAILLHLDNNKFPLNAQGTNAIVDHCVNSEDPSTSVPRYLTVDQQGIKCNNKLVPEVLMGTYIGSDGVKTFQYSLIVDGRLRVNFQRETGDRNYSFLGMGLIRQTYEKENKSFMDPGFNFTYPEVKGCFWNELPKYPDEVIDNIPNCANAPAVQTITNITGTSLQFSTGNTEAKTLKWRIKSGAATSASGTVTLSGNNASVSYASLAAGNYSLEIEGNDCSSSPSSKSFSVVSTPCSGGPTINTIKNLTATSLTVDFSGTNIPNIAWTIKRGASVAASGKSAVSANSASINYGTLSNGNYTLEIQGGDCSSGVSSRDFVVSSACQGGPTLLAVQGATATGLTFSFDGLGVTSVNWKITKDTENGAVMRQNSVSPQSSTPAILYETLPTGIYFLQIQGGSCTSAVSMGNQGKFGVNIALPIYIASFDAHVAEKGIELSWKVVEEKNGEGFEILRLNSDLKTSDIIGKVALTEQRLGNYTFTDENPVSGTNYYQLKQIDKDGSFIKSKVVTAKFDLITEAIIAPNPVKETVYVRFNSRISEKSNINIYNLAGIQLSSTPILVKEGFNSHRINVTKLADGNYILKVAYGDQSANLRFLKTN